MLSHLDPNTLYQPLMALTLALPRWLGCMMILPAMIPTVLRGTLRNVIALALALPTAGGLYVNWPANPPQGWVFCLLATKEVALGAMLGILLAMPFWLFQSIGVYIDNQRGANAMQISNPSVGADASALGGLLNQALVVLAMDTGAFLAMLAFIDQSYLAWPAWQGLPAFSDRHIDIWVEAFNDMLVATLLYVAPPMILMMLIDLGFALLGLVAPQLQIYFAAMPIKSLAALLVLAVYLASLWEFGGQSIAQTLTLSDTLWRGVR
ncbi:type III secretion system export apparatus subunit SctT [Chitinivorax sp. B]|uniref:type III secretion system export apparatus subunit SctT n=1 Tax=Chitinivorax sp. B TaxID=2502235 RepID=UPI0010F58DAA|nr:type III secretion system export apparatus subunit SctT [Chitinivorax sp. B]